MQKKKRGRVASLAGIGVLVFLSAALASEAIGQPRQVSLDELTEGSSDVVLASVAAKQSFWNANQTRISTEVRLRVSDRIKGNAADETIVIIPGGQVGNTLYDVSDMPVFLEGEEVVVFLWREPSGRHTVTGAAQGKLRVVQGEGGERILEPGAAHLFREGIDEAGAPGAPHNVTGLERRHVRLDDFVRAVKRAELD